MSKIVLPLLCLFVIRSCKKIKIQPGNRHCQYKTGGDRKYKKSPIQVEPGTIKKAFRVFC